MSCVSVDPLLVWPSKHPDDDDDYYVDFERECVRYWQGNVDFAVGVRIRGQRATGFEYEATTGGRTANRHPILPTVIGQTVVDGSVTWTCRAMSALSLRRTIAGTPTWTADTGITATSPGVSGTVASARLGSGVDGQDYSVAVRAVFSDGADKTAVVLLPVRVPANCL